jgi:hypothetical protein
MKESGRLNVELLLEPFAMGQLSDQEADLVEAALRRDPALRDRMEEILDAGIIEAWDRAAEPGFGIRGKVVFEALNETEQASEGIPPIIHSRSRIEDYEDWVNSGQEALDNMEGNLVWVPIGSTEDTNSYLVRISSPVENPSRMRELERVLVLDGHCTLNYGERVFHLGPGDTFVLASSVQYTAFSPAGESCTFICQRTKVGN